MSSWPTEPRTARPERPELSDTTPPPVFGKAAVPAALRRAQSMWYVVVTLVFFAIVTMFLTRASLATYVTDLLHQEDGTIKLTTLADAAPNVVYGAIAALVVLGVPEWLFARTLSRPRQWPRLVMVPLALLHVAIAAVCALVVPLSSWQGWVLDAVLGVGALIALLAAGRAFAPAASRWIRTRRAEERAPAV